MHPVQGALGGHALHGGYVATGAEHRAGSGHDDHPNGRISFGGLDRLGQGDAQLDVDRVALLRPVEGDGAHRRVVVDEYRAGGRLGHWPLNFGGRRSITARSPSSASWVPDNSETVRDSSASRCSTEAPNPFHTRRLVAETARVGELARVLAISVARVDSSSSGTVSVISPISRASAADKVGLSSSTRSA